MKYLLLKNNIVENIIVAELESLEAVANLFPDHQVEEYQGGVGIGWIKTEAGYDPPSLPDPVVLPDWDSFNATMLGDISYNQTVGAVLQLAPAVATGLPTTLAQVATNGVSSFSILYNAFCQIGQVSAEQRGGWADLAEGFNLPADFVVVLRG